MESREFHDELDNLVRDVYLPDDKKAQAIAKLVEYYYVPKAKAEDWLIECERLQARLMQLEAAG